MRISPNFNTAIEYTGHLLRDYSHEVQGTRWQSSDVSDKPDMRMREILNHSFQVSLMGYEALDHWRKDIGPNLPWADDHFAERVSGEPLNPGVQWANWPYAHSADRFRTESDGKFSHTYMERIWPKYAGLSTDEYLKEHGTRMLAQHGGIRYAYGDLHDVVNHLGTDPLTRQAFLPIWFPEDTGVVHGERVPCTLGYHWIMRGGYLHTTYYIRSCDFVRHFRDDLYLTVRLTLWLLEQLRRGPRQFDMVTEINWENVKAGMFTFHCVSMHMFINDYNKLWGKK